MAAPCRQLTTVLQGKPNYSQDLNISRECQTLNSSVLSCSFRLIIQSPDKSSGITLHSLHGFECVTSLFVYCLFPTASPTLQEE